MNMRFIEKDKLEIGLDDNYYPFDMKFMVLYRENNPDLVFDKVPDASYNMPSWKVTEDTDESKIDFLPHEFEVLERDSSGRTMNYFKTGEIYELTAIKIINEEDKIKLVFPSNDKFDFYAEINIQDICTYPVIKFNLDVHSDGWYSVGYYGVPSHGLEKVDSIWQPLIWQQKRFPMDSYLTLEFNCPIPAALYTKDNITYGVVVDPSEMPYRMPTAKNSRFGVMVRNAEGDVQPMVFAPAMGGVDSYMKKGDKYSFKFQPFVFKGEWPQAFRFISKNIYGFKDYRENVNCNLNKTFENMVKLCLNDHYSGWNKELKGSSYQTDVPGTVKNVSTLHVLGIALVTDEEDILKKRAVPVIEYSLSREKTLYATKEEIAGQGASHLLDGPCVPASELAAVYNVFNKEAPVLLNEIEKIYNKPQGRNKSGIRTGDTWQNALALYRASGKQEYLEKAREKAKKYIQQRVNEIQSEFEEGCFFWTEFVPGWTELMEIYEETGDVEFLEAAVKGAEEFCTFIWMSPPIPKGEILVNKGGKASKYWYARGQEPMSIPEEKVPAWRVSEIGLTCEASGTGHGHRGIFMAFHAPALLRLAHYSGKNYFKDVARSAVIGRYSNFPGYHMNTERSTVYEKEDYPYHEFEELTYNTFHYNHMWPHASMILDYLLSDVFYRSGGKINFPSEYSECYAYMQSKVYGNKSGSFYDRENIWLWMPEKLVSVDNIQINYVSARSKDKLYVAFTNQCSNGVTTKVCLNESLLGLQKRLSHRVNLWKSNVELESMVMKDGEFQISIEANGITAVEIEDVLINTSFQHKILNKERKVISENSYGKVDTSFGEIKFAALSMETGVIDTYIYLKATEKELREVKLNYYVNNEWKQLTDNIYPFEFTILLNEEVDELKFNIEAIRLNGDKETSPVVIAKVK
jgi:hypothetical protein